MKACNFVKINGIIRDYLINFLICCTCDVILYGGILQSYRWFVISIKFCVKFAQIKCFCISFLFDMGRIDSAEGARKMNTLTPMDSQASKMLEAALQQMDGIISGK